jgi:hypothetical protein
VLWVGQFSKDHDRVAQRSKRYSLYRYSHSPPPRPVVVTLVSVTAQPGFPKRTRPGREFSRLSISCCSLIAASTSREEMPSSAQFLIRGSHARSAARTLSGQKTTNFRERKMMSRRDPGCRCVAVAALAAGVLWAAGVADLKAENRLLAKRLDKAAAERWKKDAK